eukprot:3652063-Pleurochrysis_carterae.AAC.4
MQSLLYAPSQPAVLNRALPCLFRARRLLPTAASSQLPNYHDAHHPLQKSVPNLRGAPVERVRERGDDWQLLNVVGTRAQPLEHWESHNLLGQVPIAPGVDEVVERRQTERHAGRDASSLPL